MFNFFKRKRSSEAFKFTHTFTGTHILISDVSLKNWFCIAHQQQIHSLEAYILRTRVIITPSLITSFKHAIHSRILRHYYNGPGASV